MGFPITLFRILFALVNSPAAAVAAAAAAKRRRREKRGFAVLPSILTVGGRRKKGRGRGRKSRADL